MFSFLKNHVTSVFFPVNSAAGNSSKVDSHHSAFKGGIQKFLDRTTVSDSDSVVTTNSTQEILPKEAKAQSPPCFRVHPVVEGNNITENFIPLFSFLAGQHYKLEFGALYRLNSELLASSTFTGHADEDELIGFLSVARETARKKRLFWQQTRLCFLLGKLCAGRLKFSQARVYFEESLNVPRESFTDFRLLANIYSNLSGIYLLQKNTASFFAMTERLAGLLLGMPDCLESLEDNIPLKYILKKAILCHNKMVEAWACHLLAKHHWTSGEGIQVVPYLERLLVLGAEAEISWTFSASHGYLKLGRLYSEHGLPHLCVSSVRRASLQSSPKLTDCLGSMCLVFDNVNKLCRLTEQEDTIPAQVAPYLHQALSFIKVQRECHDQYYVLNHHLSICLCQLFCKYKMVCHAIWQMHTLINNNPPSQRFHIAAAERNNTLIWLAWLHIHDHQPEVALDILDLVLATMPEHCTTPQEGLYFSIA